MVKPRFYLIASGTACYDHLPEEAQLPSVDRDLDLVSRWFTHIGYRRVLSGLGRSPTTHALKRSLGGWLTAKERSPRDRLILYYSGHGESVDDDAHFLLARNSKYKSGKLLSHTALADAELARLIANSPIQHALVFLDTCYAGRGITGLSATAGALLRKRNWDEATPHGIYLVAASRPREKAREHVFAPALVESIANANGRLGGRMQQFLDRRG